MSASEMASFYDLLTGAVPTNWLDTLAPAPLRSLGPSIDSLVPGWVGGLQRVDTLSDWGGTVRGLQPVPPKPPEQAKPPTMTQPTAATTAQSAATGPAADLENQIAQMAADRYGPAAGRVTRAVLRQEAGLTGTVGDTNIPGVGSYGPFQFHGPGGQLDAYAQSMGNMPLTDAGAFARTNPLHAANWALNAYFGQALRAGVDAGDTDEALLRRVLNVQNSGAPFQDYARHLGAAAPAAPAAAPMTDPQAPVPTGTTVQAGGQTWRVAFGFNENYGAAQFNPSIPKHRGVDLVLPGYDENGRGQPVVPFVPGTVAAITHDPHGGNGVIVQAADGLYHRYFHLDRVYAREGQYVDNTVPLGTVGATGTEGFPHLHYEVSRGINGDPMNALLSPLPYLQGR